MLSGLKKVRAEILLALSLLVPALLPRAGGLDGFVGSAVAPVLPDLAAAPATEDPWAEAARRLTIENADLRARLLALGEPARLVAEDPAFFARNPLRVEAGVVGRDASAWRGSLLASAGAREGLRPGLPAVVGGALAGRAVEVGPLATRVRLLTDPGQRVWAEIVSDGVAAAGCVTGTGALVLEMQYVRVGTGRPGDPVFTAVGDPLVPRGLLLGKVKVIADADRDGLSEVEIEPAVRPEDIRYLHFLVTEGP